MAEREYSPPVSKLFTYGRCEPVDDWPDYLALGLGMEHVPDLIRLATEEELYRGDEERTETWAPVHAFRALGQLRAEAAIEPLTQLLRLIDENSDDWIAEELPLVFAMIGPAAIPALTAYLADAAHPIWSRVAASTALRQIGQTHPEAAQRSVSALTAQLEEFAENDYELNALIVEALADLKAVDSMPVIERAYAADRVDDTIIGDLEDARILMGLKAVRDQPRSRRLVVRDFSVDDDADDADDEDWEDDEDWDEDEDGADDEGSNGPARAVPLPASPKRKATSKAKAKRKSQRQSRKKNRKGKKKK